MRATSNKRTSTIAMFIVLITLASAAAWPQSPLSEEKKKKLSSYDPSDVFPVSREKTTMQKAGPLPRRNASAASIRPLRPKAETAQRSAEIPRPQVPLALPTPGRTNPSTNTAATTQAAATPITTAQAPSAQSVAPVPPAVPATSVALTPPVTASTPATISAPASNQTTTSAVEIEDANRSRGKILSLPVLISLIVIALITLIAMIIKLMRLTARTG